MHIRLICGHLLGYLLAVLGPVVLDPRLTTHIRFGARTYPDAWMCWPLAGILFLSQLLIARTTRKDALLYLHLLPFVLVSIATLFVFRPPEFPHMNVVFVTCGFLVLSAITIFLHCTGSGMLSLNLHEPYDRAFLSDYLKDYVSFWKQATMTTIALYFGLIISWYKLAVDLSKDTATDKGEARLLTAFSCSILGAVTVYYIVGPVLTCVKYTLLGLQMQKQLAKPRL